MSRSKKWRLEWVFFLGENGRRQYNHASGKLPNIFLLIISIRLIICLENDIIIVK